MITFEQLLAATKEELGAMLAGAKVNPQGDPNSRRDRIAKTLGLKTNQLLCAAGFNPVTEDYPTAIHYLGFSSFESFAAERNYQLIHDRYTTLSVDNILQIYAVLGRDMKRRSEWSDLIMTRLTTIESQLEETINPILIGGYKLEIRGVYENQLATDTFVKIRLATANEVLRDIANECEVILETATVSPEQFLAHPSVTINEKTRMINRGRIKPAELERYFSVAADDDDLRRLKEAAAQA